MKFISTWSAMPGTINEAVGRFLAGQAAPVEGVALLGRWHNTDCSGGFSLYETDNPVALFEGAAKWADVLEIQTIAVIDDAEAGPVYAKLFKK